MSYVNADKLKLCFIAAFQNLDNNKDMLNSLNVFPVPDGDTGTNMSLTMKSAINQVENLKEVTVESVSKAASNGSLMGARGNSGVITSQILRGFAQGLEGVEDIGVVELKDAFVGAYKAAYKAVMKPTEGTILTVIRGIGEYAETNYDKFDNIENFITELIIEGNRVLDTTPELLPILKQAGVVDAGGKGLMCLIEGAANYKDIKIEPKKNITYNNIEKVNIDDEDIEFGYCTEFMIHSEDGDYLGFRNDISSFGDCILVVKGDDLIKVHIHTNEPGTVLQKAMEIGFLSDIKIDNMRIQHKHVITDDDSIKALEEKERKEAINQEEKEYGFVAISTGKGLNDIFFDLGVDKIISGGQTMNPSTEDILTAIDMINAKNIYVLPNNSNIILAAEQAKTLSEKQIYVIKTKSIPQGYAALLAFDESESPESNYENMIEGVNNIVSSQVTFAVRDTEINGLKVKKGDYLGIQDGEIKHIGKKINKVTLDLIKNGLKDDSCLITIYYGSETEDHIVDELERKLNRQYKDLDIEILKGGQPLYYYLISIE